MSAQAERWRQRGEAARARLVPARSRHTSLELGWSFLVENRADTYGALGIAAALLFSLVLVGRLAVVSAELNAVLFRHHAQV